MSKYLKETTPKGSNIYSVVWKREHATPSGSNLFENFIYKHIIPSGLVPLFTMRATLELEIQKQLEGLKYE